MPIDEKDVFSWFDDHETPTRSIEVRAHIINDKNASKLESFMAEAIPSCYISPENLDAQKNNTGLPVCDVIKNKLPDAGSVMAGDFGEILTLFYLAGDVAETAKKVKKWRFKQDRTKPSPHSDVIILYREHEGRSSINDFVICAEAKLKSTSSTFSPIEKSLEGYRLDKTGRLARTLVWLKEKEIDHGNAESIAFMKRFTKDHLDTEYKKRFRAVAIIDRKYLDAELSKSLDIPPQNDEFEIIVLGISDLKITYERSYSKAVSEVVSE